MVRKRLLTVYVSGQSVAYFLVRLDVGAYQPVPGLITDLGDFTHIGLRKHRLKRLDVMRRQISAVYLRLDAFCQKYLVVLPRHVGTPDDSPVNLHSGLPREFGELINEGFHDVRYFIVGQSE